MVAVVFADVQDPVTIVQTGGVVGVLLVILWGGVRKWWVFGWRYTELEKERDEWKALALRSTNLAESLSELRRGGS